MNKVELINHISRLEGIIDEYYDVWGNKQTASIEVKEAILKSLGYPVENINELGESYKEVLYNQASRVLEPVYFIKAQGDRAISFRLADEHPVDRCIEIILSDNDKTLFKKALKPSDCILAGRRETPCGVYNEFQFTITEPLEIGYYTLKLDTGKNTFNTRLIVHPFNAYLPDLLKEKKLWGLGVNLFEINSSKNQGIGDFTDLKSITHWVGKELNGDFVAINPLHATTNQYPLKISPYAPLSRFYLNPIYLDLRAVTNSENISSSVVSRVEELKKERFINYDAIYEIKHSVLKKAFEDFYNKEYISGTHEAELFRKYMEREGRLLHEYALFMALLEHFKKRGLNNWADWPSGFRSPEDFLIKDFEKRNEMEILYHKYTQWLLESELEKAQKHARDSGMAIGLYRDMAVGSVSEGADVWANQDIFVNGCSVGAPPDTFSPLGQNWGFPPICPSQLRKKGYEFFINLIRKNLYSGGALRIDHALGLFRLYWIPDGFPPDKGVYIKYPAEELLKIIALESVRQKAVIVAEDLGTVPDEVRSMLHQYGMLSFRLLYFEKDYSTGEYLPPSAYPDMAIVSTTTHDLPTIYGFWEGNDIKIKEKLNRYPSQDALAEDIRQRQYDRWRLLRALKNEGLLPEGIGDNPDKIDQMTEPLCIAIYKYLARTPSKLLMVNLNDIIGIKEQTNLPGTLTEYPNWQRKHPIMLEDIVKRPFSWLKQLRNSSRHKS